MGLAPRLPTPLSSSSTAGMDTVRNTAIAGGIKAGRACRMARLKLSGMFVRGRDSPKSSWCSLCGRSKDRVKLKKRPTTGLVYIGRGGNVPYSFGSRHTFASRLKCSRSQIIVARGCKDADMCGATDTCAESKNSFGSTWYKFSGGSIILSMIFGSARPPSMKAANRRASSTQQS